MRVIGSFPFPRYTALGSLTAVSLACAVGYTQPAQAAGESVEALVQRGIQLRRAGDDEAALDAFLEAEQQSPNSARVILHIAAAAQAAGKWVTAHEYLKKVAAERNDPYYRAHKAEIGIVEAAVNQRVGRFQAMGGPEDAQVKLNGDEVGALPMLEAQPVEAGSYVLEVSKPGYYLLRKPVTVLGGVLAREVVELNKREAPPSSAFAGGAGQVGAAGSTGNGTSLAVDAGPPPEWWAASWVTWTLAGTAATSALVSGAAFIYREDQASKYNDNDRCLSEDQPTQTRDALCGNFRDRAELAQTIGIVGAAGAVVFGGAALTHWLATKTPANGAQDQGNAVVRKPESARVQCAPGFMAVACHGTF